MIVSWIGLILSLISTATGQVVYKIFSQRKGLILLLFSVGFFVGAQFANYFALRNLDIGFVYMFAGVTHILILLGSGLVLKEKITSSHLWAVSLIVVGLFIYGYGYGV